MTSARTSLRVVLPRLVLPALLLFGWWLWKSDLFPQGRQLVWRLDSTQGPIEFLEVQLYDSRGALLKREEFYFESAGQGEVTQHIPLRTGDYGIRVFVRHRRAEPSISYWGTLHVRAEETIVLSLGDLSTSGR